MSMQIYDPTLGATGRSVNFVPRPKSLAGLRIGLVDNTKHNSDQLLLRIAKLLEDQHGAKTHIIRKKKSAGSAPSPEMVKEYTASCDIVVAGVGDWGSCSSGSVLDSIVFEQQGVPSASIITDIFKVTGKAMATTWGLPDFKFIAMPHPIANLKPDELDQRAAAILPEVVKLLLEGQAPQKN